MLLADGSAWGRWSDGCSLVLHPGMRTATLRAPDGSALALVSATAPSAARHKLAALLAFRNMTAAHEPPVLDKETWTGPTFTSNRPFSFARWSLQQETSPPFNPNAQQQQREGGSGWGLDGGVVNSHSHSHSHSLSGGDAQEPVLVPVHHQADGSIVVEALDCGGRISLTLLANGQWVRLRFPLALGRTVSGSASSSSAQGPGQGGQGQAILDGSLAFEYLYADFAQLVPIAAVPPQWNLPLRSALKASHVQQIEAHERRLERQQQQQQPQQQQADPASCHSSSFSSADSDLDFPLDHAASSTSGMDVVMDLAAVRSLRPLGGGAGELHWPGDSKPALSLALLHSMADSLPRAENIVCTWTHDALYWTFVSSAPAATAAAAAAAASGAGAGPGAEGPAAGVSVCVLIHEDQSCLVLKENGFFAHFLEPYLAAADGSDENADTTNGQQHWQPKQQLGSRKKVYAPGAVPGVHNASGLNLGEAQYELGRIGGYATRLREHALGVLQGRVLAEREVHRQLAGLAGGALVTPHQRQALAALDPAAVARAAQHEVLFSAAVHERCFQRNVGEFTAFKDGRIKSEQHNTAQHNTRNNTQQQLPHLQQLTASALGSCC